MLPHQDRQIATLGIRADTIRTKSLPYSWSSAILTIGCFVLAVGSSLLFAIANSAYFEAVEGLIHPSGSIHRALLFSSWPLLVGGIVVVWNPRAFGFRLGRIARNRRLIAGMSVVAVLTTALLLRITGPTPYSEASLLVETVVVPITEELVFRGVLLTVLLAALGRLHGPDRAIRLAVAIDGVAFGLAHVANASVLDLGFVLSQAAYASVLGVGCAYLMTKCRSIYPAMFLHALVNGVVVAL
jgi:membrane protease YdiL (CAAX protease family)